MATYLQLAALATNADFLSRVGYAIGKFAAYIQNEDPGTSGHLARRNWQLKAQNNVQQMAIALAGEVCRAESVIAALDAVTDADLQIATETAANGLIGTAVSYTELAALAVDNAFLRRAQMAVVKFANYILNEDPASANHASRYAWARNAILNTLAVATALAPAVVMGSVIVAALLATTDDELQSAVEFEVAQLLL